MARTSRVWIPVLVGCLVAGVLGVGGGGAVAVEPRTVTASIMIPAAAFIPTSDNWDYKNANTLYLNTGSGYFSAPLSFPVPVVNIKRITLYASDSTSDSQVCLTLYRSRPPTGAYDDAGTVCTEDSATRPQTVYTTAISPRQVNTAFHGPFLWLSLSGPGVIFYGAKINYSYDPGA